MASCPGSYQIRPSGFLSQPISAYTSVGGCSGKFWGGPRKEQKAPEFPEAVRERELNSGFDAGEWTLRKNAFRCHTRRRSTETPSYGMERLAALAKHRRSPPDHPCRRSRQLDDLSPRAAVLEGCHDGTTWGGLDVPASSSPGPGTRRGRRPRWGRRAGRRTRETLRGRVAECLTGAWREANPKGLEKHVTERSDDGRRRRTEPSPRRRFTSGTTCCRFGQLRRTTGAREFRIVEV